MTTEEIITKILIPSGDDWKFINVEVNEDEQTIYVDLSYDKETVSINEVEYPIYDFRPIRKWRHLDLWQYKTFIRARLPRYVTGKSAKTIEVPWADPLERMTLLFEKKR